MKLLVADFIQTSSCFISLRFKYFLKYFFPEHKQSVFFP